MQISLTEWLAENGYSTAEEALVDYRQLEFIRLISTDQGATSTSLNFFARLAPAIPCRIATTMS